MSAEEPTTTKELYRSLVERAQLQEERGKKTSIYRNYIEHIGKETGDTKILFQAAFSLICKAHPGMKINRSHVRNVVEHNWEVTIDEENKDLIWIDLSKPKTPRLTDGSTVH